MSDKINYTAEDIALYLEGKMSPAQMHALEKAALSDPFLADALEGMEMHGSARFNADAEELRARLTARGKSKSKSVALASVSSLWWKIAAVLIIVITGVAIIIFTGKKNQNAPNEIAKTESKLDNNAGQADKRADTVKPQTQNEKTQGQEVKAVTKKQVPARKAEEKKEQKEPPVEASKETVLYNKVDPETMEKADEANVRQEVASSKRPSAAAAAPIADSVFKESDTMFDEVIVVGYGSAKKNNNKLRTVLAGRAEKRVIPGNGWHEFEQYIEDSTKINTADSVFTGEEHLLFTIGDDGLPESIKILRSISPSHDREAIRLLQNGPSWKVAKGRKREIRLKIIF
jgi:outer membrane biosynthesis protein TonB